MTVIPPYSPSYDDEFPSDGPSLPKIDLPLSYADPEWCTEQLKQALQQLKELKDICAGVLPAV